MLKRIYRGLLPCLLAILWSSHGYSMKALPQEDAQDLPPVKFLSYRDLGLSQSTTQTSPEKPPLSYEFLIIKYAYSDEYINHINKNDGNDTEYAPFSFNSYTRFGYEIKPLKDRVIPYVIKWKLSWDT